VGVDCSSLQADSQSKLVDLVQVLLATWVCIYRMSRVNSCNGLAMMTALETLTSVAAAVLSVLVQIFKELWFQLQLWLSRCASIIKHGQMPLMVCGWQSNHRSDEWTWFTYNTLSSAYGLWNAITLLSLWHIWKFSCESYFRKPLSKENFQMWHTHLRKFLLAKVNFQE